MRLTLRTMLAYMDDILEPADREEIERKIAESEFATQLMQRIRECIRKSRLGAPRLSGKRVGLDPNAVAEYLDNTLAGERVPEFERVCLESDVELAEVASCHQILTMVLGQPANIDPAMRGRMYDIASHVEQIVPAAALNSEGPSAEMPDDVHIAPARGRPEIPDYLRQRTAGSRWRSVVAGVVLLLLLAAAITMALGPLDHTNPVARLLGIGEQPAANQVAQNAPAEEQPDAAAQSTVEVRVVPSAENPAQPAASDTVQPAASDPARPAANDSAQPAAIDAAQPAVSDSEQPPAAAGQSPADSTVAAPITAPDLPQTDLTAPPAPGDSTATAAPAPTAVVGETAPPGDSVSSGSVSSGSVPAGSAPAGSMPIVETPPLERAPQVDDTPLGRFLPAKDLVLLALDEKTGQWVPLAAGAPLSAGDRLLVLPTYRPTVTLSAGVTMQISSGTLLEFEAPDAKGIPGLKLLFGRLVAMTTGQAGSQLRLDLGGVRGVVTFVDPEATLGVEVVGSYLPGTDPESEEPRLSADLYAASGQIQWTASDGATQKLDAPQRLALAAATPGAPGSAEPTPPQIPKWVGAEQVSSLNARAAAELARALEEQRPLLLTLREMTEHRKVENRSLAAQCLALLEEFEPLVKAFNDPDQRPMWPSQMAGMREALDRGPATATKVREAFEKQRGQEQGKQLYRMFWGYSKDDLQNGEATRLVDYLRSEGLDFRVLAFLNLQEITGRTYNYRPESPAVGREQPYRRWQDDLSKGLIVPRAK